MTLKPCFPLISKHKFSSFLSIHSITQLGITRIVTTRAKYLRSFGELRVFPLLLNENLGIYLSVHTGRGGESKANRKMQQVLPKAERIMRRLFFSSLCLMRETVRGKEQSGQSTEVLRKKDNEDKSVRLRR